MKLSRHYIWIIIGVIALAALIYWQQNKRSIIRKSIGTAVAKKTDNLYYLKYDSSVIDELGGNASFFNVVLQSDSVQKRIAEEDTTDNIIYQVRIGEVAVRGADIPGLLSGNKVKARLIELINPDIWIIKLGKKVDEPFSQKDSLAIYEKILGNFKSIQAEEIAIKDGNLNFSTKGDLPHTTLQKINISIKDFRIDSTKDYTNLVSYFIKGVVANVQSVKINKPGKGELLFDNIEYDAAKRMIRLGKFQQKNNSGKIVTDINAISVDGLATNIFINEQKLYADELSTGGGMISIYKKKSKNKGTDIELDSSFFDRAALNKITIGKTRVMIYDRAKPAEAPQVLNNITFTASDIPVITSGNTFKNILSNSKWILGGDGITGYTKDKLYEIKTGPFTIDKYRSEISVQKISILPQISEAEFIRTRKVQEDFFELEFRNIKAGEVDIRALLEDKAMIAGSVSLQPNVKIFRDLTLPMDTKSKMGKYPHQVLRDLGIPLTIGRINLQNGNFSYRERGAISKQVGQIFFDKLAATISNVTNNKEIIKRSPNVVLQSTSKFMGVSNFTTKWILPINSPDGSFSLEGKLGAIDGPVLNAALEPLGMASVRRGNINGYDFKTTGNDITATTTSTLLYKDLKIEVLKKNQEKNDLTKKTAVSFLANILVRDENPHNKVVRKNAGEYKRVIEKSFFNLAWKSIFVSLKNTVIGKNNAK
ncbi:MAG: hypothetical protein WKF35_01365 [Ferruginibacter sp.]